MHEDAARRELTEKFGNRLRLRVSGICLNEGKVLMVKHRMIGQGKYLWAPPGGGLDYHESARETLVREFEEETGLTITPGEFLFVNEFHTDPLHAIELFFRVEITGGQLQRGADPEMSEEHQIITEVAFLDESMLKKENPLQIHSVFRNIEKISELITKRGYFYSQS